MSSSSASPQPSDTPPTPVYRNPTPVAVALVQVGTGGGLLVGRRAIEPRRGQFALPGGYVNEGESAEVAVARELEEETGFVIPAAEWVPVTTRVTPGNQLLIFLRCDTVLSAHDLLRFVPREECDLLAVARHTDTLAFRLHTEILRTPVLWYR